jgi:hypothetical protein
MGVDFHKIIIWIEVIRVAISLIVQDLKSYNELNTIQNAIQRARQNLATWNMMVEQRQHVVESLISLQNKGISDTELIELSKLVNSWSSNGICGNGSKTNGFRFKLDEKLGNC